MRAREDSKTTGKGGPGHLADFLTMTFDAVVAFDSRDRITYWNPAAEKIFGWSSGEALGKTSAELFWPLNTPEDQEMQAQHRLKMQRGESIQGEHQLRRKDGSPFWVEYKMCAAFDKKGGLSGYRAVYRNITAMKTAQEDISQLHTELHAWVDEINTLLEVLPTGVWIGNEDCSVITGNRAAYKMLGLEQGINASLTHPGPKTPSGLRLFVNGKEVSGKELPMQQVARSREPLHNLEHELLFPDGTKKTVHASIVPVLDENGRVKKVIGAYTDFTERKQLEEQIRFISRMPAENPNPAMRLMPDGKILYTNPAGRSLLESWEQQTDQALPEDLRRQVAQVIASNVKKQIEIEHDGRIFFCTLAPVVEGGYVNLYAIDVTEHKRAVEKLRQSEERLAATYHLAPIGIMECSTDGRYLNVNEEFCNITGYERSELLGMHIKDLTHEDDYFFDITLHERLLAGRIPYYRLEKRYVRKDGTILWVEVTRSLVRGSQGEALYTVGAVVNITDRKRADQALAESVRLQATLYQLTDRLQRADSPEAIYNAALDAILDALPCDRASILLFDEQDVMRFVAWRGLSEEYRAATDGHSPWRPDAKDPEPITLADITTADLNDSLRAAIQKEGIGSLAFIPLVSNGRLIGKFMVYCSQPHVFHEGEIDLSLTIAHQLAFGVERSRAEAKIRESEERYRTIVDTANEGIWYVSLEARTMYLNEQMARLLGHSVEEVIGHRVSEFCFEEDVPQAKARIASNFQGNSEHFDFRFRCKGGDEVFVLASTGPVRDAEGKILGALGMFVDITDRKRAEDELRASESELEKIINSTPFMLTRCTRDLRYRFVSRAYAEMIGRTPVEVAGRPVVEIMGEVGLHRILPYIEEVLQGRSVEYDEDVNFEGVGTRFLHVNYTPDRDEDGNVIGWFESIVDISERKRAEARLVLLSIISEIVRTYEDPGELLYAVSEAVGEHLQVRRCLFNETDLEKDLEIIHRDYVRGVESVAGVHRISDYSSVTSAEMAAGKTVVNYDSKVDPRTSADYERSYAVHGERAYIAVPLMRDNRWVAALWVSDDVPRAWHREEIALLESVAERTWLAVEKLRVNSEFQKSEDRLGLAVTAGQIGIWDIDLRRQERTWSKEGKAIYGLAEDELLDYERQLALTHPEDRGRVDEMVRAFRDLGSMRQLNLEHRIVRPDGSLRWVEVHGEAIYEEGPLPVRLIGTIVDITERKQMEQALARERELLERLVETMPVMVSIYDPETDSLHLNTEFESVLGWKTGEMTMRSLLESIYPDPEYRAMMVQRMNAATKNEWVEMRVQTREGRTLDSLWANASVPGGVNIGIGIDVTQRKQAEEALRRSQDMFSTLIESAPFGVYFIDSQFRLQAINKGSEAVFSGIDPLIGRDFAEILRHIWQEPFATEAIERFRHTLRTGESYISPTIIGQRANIDEIQAYDWQIHRITLSDGSLGVVCYFYDLSEQKQLEATVRASESLYRTIARSIPGGGVYVVDKEMRYIVAEGPVTEALGPTRQTLEGRTIREAFPDERGRRMEDRLKRTFAGETVSFETRHEGRVYWTQQAPLHDTLGQAIIVTLDITERKQAEEALRQSEERFARFMQHLPGLAWIKDRQGRYMYVNAAAEKAFNRRQDELFGKTDMDIFPLEVADQFRRNDEQALTQSEGVQVIETLMQNDGVLHYSLVSKFPIPGPDGSIMLIGGTAFDITDRIVAEQSLREHERQLKELNETLERKVRERTQEVRRLASDLTRAEQRERDRIAHILHDDLQQRLYALQMQMTFLHSGVPTQDARLEKELTEFQSQLDEAVLLTRRLSIDLSPPILQDEGLTQAISWLAAQMKEQHGLDIELQSEGGSFAIADSELQVLLFNCVRELLFNIVKHAGVDRAWVSLQRLNGDLQIQIHDQGKGFDIDPSVPDADVTRGGDEIRRASFGLPTIRRQLSLFGGRIDITSAPGAGTHITLTLPAFADSTRPASSGRPQEL